MPRTTRDGLEFGPNDSGKLYMSMNYHRGTRNPNKSTWHQDFKPQEEYELFDRGDRDAWRCARGHQWGIAEDGSRRLGSGGERVSFCPMNENLTVPWHGYPVFAEGAYKVPEEVIAIWEDGCVVGRITAKRLRRESI